MVAPEFIDRVELFLGPTGMLSNMPLYAATGGAVNLVTKKAYDQPLTELTTSYLSDGQVANHLDVGRRYGLNKQWGIRVNGVYRDGDTAIDYQEETLGLGTVALDYHGTRVRTSLDIGYQVQDWDAPTLYLTYNGPEGKISSRQSGSNPFQPWSFSDTDDFFAAWQGEVDVAPNVTLFAAAGYLDNFNLFLSPYQEIEDRAGNTTVYPLYLPQTLENVAGNVGLRTNFSTGPLKHALRLRRAEATRRDRLVRHLFRSDRLQYLRSRHSPSAQHPRTIVGRSAQNREVRSFEHRHRRHALHPPTSPSRSRSASAVERIASDSFDPFTRELTAS